MFSDRDPAKVLKHLNSFGDDVQVINVFLQGTKIVAVYKTKDEKEEKKKLKQQG